MKKDFEREVIRLFKKKILEEIIDDNFLVEIWDEMRNNEESRKWDKFFECTEEDDDYRVDFEIIRMIIKKGIKNWR